VAYVVVEDALILGALLGALAFAHFGLSWLLDSPLALLHLALLVVAIKAAFFCTGLYDFSRMITRRAFWRRNLIGIAAVAVGAWLAWAVPTGERVACGAFLLAFAPAILLGRLVYEVVAGSHGFRRRLLFLGIGMQARRTAREILDTRSRDYDLLGFLAEKPDEMGWRIGQRSVLGLYRDLEKVVEQERVDAVVVALDDRRRQLPMEALLRIRLGGVEVLEEARVHEEIAGKIPVEDLRPSWLIFSEGFANSGLRISTKRAFDLTISALGLLLTVPLGLLAALLIKLESKGPVLFRQVRVGKGGREFVLLKFRSMREDAEREGTPLWASKDDPRVTRVGRILRKTRIDEIPQMLNVLRGEMSFVGPRPERPYFVEQLRGKIPFYDQRHAVKPGITGWAQVRFRYGSDETDAVEKLRHDMFYIKHHSILFDLRTLLETVRVVFRRDMGR
jgi:sugar transferase (PEP-CTERM system associated)